MNLKNCHNFNDFRELARRKLPSPIYNYIDGGAVKSVITCLVVQQKTPLVTGGVGRSKFPKPIYPPAGGENRFCHLFLNHIHLHFCCHISMQLYGNLVYTQSFDGIIQ
ncbi:MAG: hypothetical protein CMF77_01935 [Candidatus Marinimicrobia bacterium]|nr:hypothetical protein [Candidatus Neomarinimicrobiota bacterium]